MRLLLSNAPAIEYVLIFFMFVSGINYTLIYYTILKGKVKKFFDNMELRTYLIIVLGASLACAVTLAVEVPGYGVEYAIRQSLFTVISLQTTTGLATVDYTLWPVQVMPVLLFVMFAGACSGSTSGGQSTSVQYHWDSLCCDYKDSDKPYIRELQKEWYLSGKISSRAYQ